MDRDDLNHEPKARVSVAGRNLKGERDQGGSVNEVKRGLDEQKGWWRMAGSPQAAEAMPKAWFEGQGLVSLAMRYAALQH